MRWDHGTGARKTGRGSGMGRSGRPGEDPPVGIRGDMGKTSKRANRESPKRRGVESRGGGKKDVAGGQKELG